MSKQMTKGDIVNFLRSRDYEFIKEIGQGACGRTVLLYDHVINEHFVCKKYSPLDKNNKVKFFNQFIDEIKLLYQTYNPNVVRVFNYFLYPEIHTGYILMEYIQGTDIENYLKQYPEQANEVFSQTIDAFFYLHKMDIVHRDIRPQNIMVSDDGIVKVIDFGFGKQLTDLKQPKKSITLNWYCDARPDEFDNNEYLFITDIYFVGKLFERIIKDYQISHFKYTSMLGRMCHRDRETRVQSFYEINSDIQKDKFDEIPFEKKELIMYRSFADALDDCISKIECKVKYIDDIALVEAKLKESYMKFMMEEYVTSVSSVVRCFIQGSYYYNSNTSFPVSVVNDFLDLLRSASTEKKRIIVSNLHTRFDSIKRYDQELEDSVPF